MSTHPAERRSPGRFRRIPSAQWTTWLAWLVAPGSLVVCERLCAWGSPLCDDAPIPTLGLVLLATHALGDVITVGLLVEPTGGKARRPEFWLLLGYWAALVAWFLAVLPLAWVLGLAWVGLATVVARASSLLLHREHTSEQAATRPPFHDVR